MTTCDATVDVDSRRLVIETGPEVDQAEFRWILEKYGVMGRTDYEVHPADDGETIVIQL